MTEHTAAAWMHVLHPNIQLTQIVDLGGPVTQIDDLGDLPPKLTIWVEFYPS